MTGLIKRREKVEVIPPVQGGGDAGGEEQRSVHRFGLFTLGLAVVASLFVLSMFYHYEKRAGEKQIKRDGSALCSLITDMAKQEFFTEEGRGNINLVDYVVREKEIVYCLVIDERNIPLLQLGRHIPEQNPEVAENSWKADYLSMQKYKEDQIGEIIYEFSKPIYEGSRKIGLVRIGLSLSNYGHLKQSAGYLVGAIALAIFSLVLIFYSLLKKLLSPLYKMNRDLKEMIGDEQACPTIEVNFRGEVGLLAQRMNQLLLLQQEKGRSLENSNTELEVANRVLHYEKCRLRAILDNLKVGVIFIDSTGKAILSNKLANHLLRAEEGSYLGESWEEFLEGQSSELVHFFRDFRQKETIYGHDFLETKVQDGDIPVTLCHDCLYLLDSEDSPLGFLWTITDITSQKQAELSRYEFVNHVAHELKTPLNTLRSYSEMLLDGEISDEQGRKEFVNSINEEAIRLSRLINNLLQISKMEVGGLTINRTLIKVDKLLSDCYQTVRAQALSKDIDFMFDVEDKMPNLLLDKDLIEVAILNLLTNAIKYTPESGKVVLKGMVEDGHVLIRVTDSGYGIEKSEIDHVFDKFFRSSREEIKNKSGTGLGLALAKNIVQMHQGEINVESTIGSGSSFTLSLPKEEVFI